MTVISAIKTIIPKVGRAAKKFSGKPLGITSKVLGAATIASVIYDSHINGKEKAYSLEQNNMADRYQSQYEQYMTMENASATTAALKKWWFNSLQTTNIPNIIDKVKGYAAGFGSTTLAGIGKIGLSAVALKSKGKLGKIAGVALILDGMKNILYDVIGIGNKNKKKY